jgi:hypothetical protein
MLALAARDRKSRRDERDNGTVVTPDRRRLTCPRRSDDAALEALALGNRRLSQEGWTSPHRLTRRRIEDRLPQAAGLALACGSKPPLESSPRCSPPAPLVHDAIEGFRRYSNHER